MTTTFFITKPSGHNLFACGKKAEKNFGHFFFMPEYAKLLANTAKAKLQKKILCSASLRLALCPCACREQCRY
ncbi:MAG: hypothetical protein ACI4IS_03905 [Acutalibacteraceae bacterium]